MSSSPLVRLLEDRTIGGRPSEHVLFGTRCLLADCPAVRWPPAAMLFAAIGLLLYVLRLCCCLRYLRRHRWLYFLLQVYWVAPFPEAALKFSSAAFAG